MAKIDLNNLDSVQRDILKEIGNIGAGNATTALAKLINSKVDMKVPAVQLVDLSDIAAIIGQEETVMAGILLLLEGDINGMMMFILDIPSARSLVNNIMGIHIDGSDREDENEFTPMETSALNEVGNIITGAYLNSLSTMTNLMIYPTPPQLTVDMASAILSVPAVEFGINGDKILLIQSQFFDEVELNGYFILIPDLESYTKILTSLGIPVEM